MKEHRSISDGKGLRVAIIASKFNDFITTKLVAGAGACLREQGVSEDDIELFWCPGALEIPALAARVARYGSYGNSFDAMVCVGCVIRGETDHYQFVSTESVHGVSELALLAKVAIGNAILTVESDEQALERSGEREMNKGWEAALAALEMANQFRLIR